MDKEKYKELMYDISRVTTQEAHDLIIEYAENGNAKTTAKTTNSDNIICIKDVIMQGTADREFTKGKTYRLTKLGYSKRFGAINDSLTHHGITMDKWFHEHFDFI